MDNAKKPLNGLTPKQNRIITGIFDDGELQQNITYSHSVLCQTSLPFKDMGEVREWNSRNGDALVLVEAGQVLDPNGNGYIKIGLPYGAKPRLILNYINAQAVKTQCREIEVENSLHAFMKALGIEPNGRHYKSIKDQLGRLAASQIVIGRYKSNGSSTTQYGRIVEGMNIFFSKDENQRVLWPNVIQLSKNYFESLCLHAVPLDEKSIYLLKDSALELDMYAMFAERLHRIKPGKPQFVPWSILYSQYGGGYSRIRDFRRAFLKHLLNVHAVYPDAKIEEEKGGSGQSKGLKLYHSRPPVLKKNFVVVKPQNDD